MEEAEEKELIRKILEECGGKISRVARMLGMSRPTLYKKMERYGLRKHLHPFRLYISRQIPLEKVLQPRSFQRADRNSPVKGIPPP